MPVTTPLEARPLRCCNLPPAAVVHFFAPTGYCTSKMYYILYDMLHCDGAAMEHSLAACARQLLDRTVGT